MWRRNKVAAEEMFIVEQRVRQLSSKEMKPTGQTVQAWTHIYTHLKEPGQTQTFICHSLGGVGHCALKEKPTFKHLNECPDIACIPVYFLVHDRPNRPD